VSFKHCTESQGTTSETTAAYRPQASVLIPLIEVEVFGDFVQYIQVYPTWSLTLREERKLRVFENMVLRRIFGPRREEVTGE
jgi:hypothetical protein